MSTSGSYNPPDAPACPYEPEMTRAQALALRTAGGLRPNCVVVITDGPVIGTAGNTSPTQIELNPVSTTDLGMSARVHTTFNASAWDGIYDIDLGAQGSIQRLTDNWDNTVRDSDTNAPTVHTQWPWHRGSATLHGNVVESSVLAGFDTAGGTINDNEITESSVNITGKTQDAFDSNRIRDTTFQTSSPIGNIRNNNLDQATVTNTSTVGQFAFRNNTFLTGQLLVSNNTENVIFTNNVMGGDFRIRIINKTVSSTNIQGNRFFNQNQVTDPEEIYISGTGLPSIYFCNMNSVRYELDGPVDTYTRDSIMVETIIRQTPSVAGPLRFIGCNLGKLTISLGSANAAVTNDFIGCTIGSGLITLDGPVAGGRNDFTSVQGDTVDWQVAATATAGLAVTGGYYSGGQVRQNRTAGTASTALNNCDVRGTTVITDNGTVNPGAVVGIEQCQFRDSALTVNSLAASRAVATAVREVDAIGSTFTVSGMGTSGFIDKGRMTGTTLDNGGFTISVFDIVGGTKTLTANQSDRLRNASFTNLI